MQFYKLSYIFLIYQRFLPYNYVNIGLPYSFKNTKEILGITTLLETTVRPKKALQYNHVSQVKGDISFAENDLLIVNYNEYLMKI